MVNPYQPSPMPVEPDEDALAGVKRQPQSLLLILTEPLTRTTKTLLVMMGIVVPICSHLFSINGLPDSPEWQTGRLGDKLSFVLTARAGWILYPFMAVSIGCLVHYLINDHRGPARIFVRWVFLGSVLIAAYYTVVMWIVLCRTPGTWAVFALAQFAIPVLLLMLPWMMSRLPVRVSKWFKIAALGLLTLGYVGGLVMNPRETLFATVAVPALAGLFSGPAWALLAYGLVSLRIGFDARPRAQPMTGGTAGLIGAVGYLLGIGVAVWSSIRLSLIEYFALPTTPPRSDCYVVTAAARGHQRIVGSWIETDQEYPRLRNRQLGRLWRFERWLAATWPRTHRITRKIYDRIGPVMAATLVNAWLADLAYLSLKPIEWSAVAVLWCFQNRETEQRETP